MKPPKIILASASPRRRSLLAARGIEFDVMQSGADETRFDHEDAATYAKRVAEDKAIAVSRRIPDAIVLAADTVVECGGVILLKPEDATEARQMLEMLADNVHTVVTAFAIAKSGSIVESWPITSQVTFRKLTHDEIEEYIATGEPYDKAGGYGIQGLAASFITRVEGSRENVMGLPVDEVIEALRRHCEIV